MNPDLTLQFLCPPTPYFMYCDQAYFPAGVSHNSRKSIGVFDLLVVKKGELFLGEGAHQWCVQAGQSLLLRPDLYHYAVEPCNEDTSFYWLHFRTTGKWQEIEGRENLQLQSSFSGKTEEEDEEIMFKKNDYYIYLPKYLLLKYPESIYSKLEQLVEGKDKSLAFDRWKQQTLFEEILKELYQYHIHSQESRSVELAESVVSYLKQNYHQPITNKLLQETFHFHPNYIAKSMQKAFGSTPIEYLMKYRIEQAKMLLIQTSWKIATIAEEVGFGQTPYFTRQFRKFTGQSPSQFRKKFIGSK
ncbi:helix-turn-helix transcriptional regulator [Gracilibacillus oryzae]|uniref:Helix-turn-helix transcriptional regulator n=1 Tax=Gracilibacillus oryzae TaxID=1672701 RepID=A0A7C8KXW1_9BACI|nr:AraC family transcriptional regulator [Gracilibacillus oryzae]KAB8133611.1 helix-turn-helix transcriptional regulator [Gracilibacillus oryzae]